MRHAFVLGFWPIVMLVMLATWLFAPEAEAAVAAILIPAVAVWALATAQRYRP